MTLALALINFHGDAAPAAHPGPLTLSVVTLIVVTAAIAGFTCWRARAAWTGARDLHLPRRGTSALLLCAIAAVLLVLVSTSEQRIPSLTIVSRNSPRPARIAKPEPKRTAPTAAEHRHRAARR